MVVSLFDSTSNSWSTPTGIHTNAAGKSQSSYSVSMSENNDAVVVYQSYGNSKWEIHAKVYDATTESWGANATLSLTANHSNNPRVVMFDNGDALATWGYYTGTVSYTHLTLPTILRV